MAIRLSHHAADKLAKELSRMGVTRELLEENVRNPDEILYDIVTGRHVAVKMESSLAVIYERKEEEKYYHHGYI